MACNARTEPRLALATVSATVAASWLSSCRSASDGVGQGASASPTPPLRASAWVEALTTVTAIVQQSLDNLLQKAS